MAKAASSGMTTVLVAEASNVLVAIAKTVAAVLSGSASMTAEAAHSWADTGNEVFLYIAERRSAKPVDSEHPLGYGRAAFVWAMIAAFGLFIAGAVYSINEGINALRHPAHDSDYTLSYIVLGISFLLEGTSFVQALTQARAHASQRKVRPFRYVLLTSRTTLRSVFFEDGTALIGLIIAASALVLHEITGNGIFDAIGSLLVGVLLGIVAFVLITRNAQFLVGEAVDPQLRKDMLQRILDSDQVAAVTFLQMEWIGPDRMFLVASVDFTENEPETVLQQRVEDLENHLNGFDNVARAVISLSGPKDQPLTSS